MADNTRVEMTVRSAEVVTVPIDDTLSIAGQAADAKAVGDALADKADRSELQNAIKVNGEEADEQGLILITGEDIQANEESGSGTIAQALAAQAAKTAEDIPVASGSQKTIAQALNETSSQTADSIEMSSTDTRTVAQVMDQMQVVISAYGQDIAGLYDRSGEEIQLRSDSSETILQAMEQMDSEAVKSVNGNLPDDSGNAEVTEVEFAKNLKTDSTERSVGSFIRRTTGGDAGVSSGSAWLQRLMGNRVHDNYTPESLEMTVIAIPRVIPDPITATLDAETLIAYVETAGSWTLTYNAGWSADPALYGVAVVGQPWDGDQILLSWDGENDPEMTVDAVERHAPDPITATIDRDVFVAYVTQSGTTNLYYTTAWSEDPALYGITVSNAPVSGDQIRVVYVKEVRGTIRVADFTELASTGWNQYISSEGYARVVRYSELYGYKIGGTWSSISWAANLTDTRQAITPDSNGLFNVPGDGYVFVTGGSDLNTYIVATWSDWTGGPSGSYAAYTEDTVDLSELIGTYFGNGMMRVANVRDEIDFQAGVAVSRIDRWEYTENNLATAKASGRPYEYDEDYIYIERLSPVITDIGAMTLEYTVDDHGMEYFDSDVPVYAEVLYGLNMADKLRRDVVTVRTQSWTAAEQAQARLNIGAASQAGLDAKPDNATEMPMSGSDSTNVSEAIGTLNSKLGNLKLCSVTNYSITLQSDSSTGALDPGVLTNNVVTRTNFVAFVAIASGHSIDSYGKTSSNYIFCTTKSGAGTSVSFDFVFFYT